MFYVSNFIRSFCHFIGDKDEEREEIERHLEKEKEVLGRFRGYNQFSIRTFLRELVNFSN